MSRRKLSFPILSASNDVLNKDYIKNNIEDLTKGEVVLNISGDNSTMLFFDENENLAIFESSVLVDKKIEKIIEEVNFGENKEVLDGITEEKVAAWDAAESNAKADAETKYQVKGDYEAAGAAAQALADAKAYTDGKVDGKFDEVGAAAQALADAKADAEVKYQVKGEYEIAGAAAAVERKLDAHKEDAVMHVTAQEKTNWNAAKSAIDTFLADADMTENALDTLKELQTYISAEGGEVAVEIVNRLSALEEIDHNAYISADTQVLADAKAYVDGKVDGKFDAVGSAAAAEAAAKSDAAAKYQVKGNYETAGAAAQALADAKVYVDDKVDNKFDEVGAAAQALADAKADAEAKYQVKGNYETAGAAAAAKDEAIASAKTWVESQDYLTSVPTEYVTEKELSDALKPYLTIVGAGELNDEIYKHIDNKVDKVSGKTLSTNDFTDALKNKLDGISSNAEVNIQSDWNETNSSSDAFIKNKPSLFSGNYNDLSNKPTIPSVDGFIKNVSLTSSNGMLYLVGASFKTGTTTSFTTSSTDVYMEDGELYATSDERLKDFGDNISVDLDKLSEIPKAYYTWKTNPQGRKMIGLSAQKIGALYPEVVSTDENGKMAVSYEKLSVIALAAIDELHKENEELKHRLKRIEEKLGL